MLFGFRADASFEIGSGHIIRCLTLAHALKLAGHDCFFICRNHTGNLIDYLRASNWKVLELSSPKVSEPPKTSESNEYQKWLGVTQADDVQDTLNALSSQHIHQMDWLIVDHYALSAEWENGLRDVAAKILVIDDLANRDHDADIVLDCGLSHTPEHYQQLNKRPVNALTGPHYALLRPEFARLRQQLRQSLPPAATLKILINLGGVDKDDCTSVILNILAKSQLPYPITTTVVMGLNAPHKDKVMGLAKTLPFHSEVKVNVSNMGTLMTQHDLAIGAAGSTAWERCCLGLPSIIVCLAANQEMIATELHRSGAAISLCLKDIDTHLEPILQSINPPKLVQMQKAALLITEGLGVERLMKHMQASA